MGNGSSGMADDDEEDDKEIAKSRLSRAEKRGSTSVGIGGHRYMTNSNAIEILGGDTWNNLIQRLQQSQSISVAPQNQRRGGGNTQRAPAGLVDFDFFANIIRSRFERMVIV